jgi:hypothetical protein
MGEASAGDYGDIVTAIPHKEELDCFRLRSSSFGGRGRRKGSSQ